MLAEGATDVGTFGAPALRDVTLRVARADGTPVTAGTVRTVDPLSESWEAFFRVPTTGSYAMFPIPAPLEVRLGENGACTLRGIGHDALTVELELDEGRRLRTVLSLPDGRPDATWVLPEGL